MKRDINTSVQLRAGSCGMEVQEQLTKVDAVPCVGLGAYWLDSRTQFQDHEVVIRDIVRSPKGKVNNYLLSFRAVDPYTAQPVGGWIEAKSRYTWNQLNGHFYTMASFVALVERINERTVENLIK